MSALVIQRLNSGMRSIFQIMSTEIHIQESFFFGKNKIKTKLGFQDRAVGAACQFCGFLRSSLITLIDSSSTRSASACIKKKTKKKLKKPKHSLSSSPQSNPSKPSPPTPPHRSPPARVCAYTEWPERGAACCQTYRSKRSPPQS